MRRNDYLANHLNQILPTLRLKEDSDFNAYIFDREMIENKYSESKNWNDVVNMILPLVDFTTQEAFIDVIEYNLRTSIKDPMQILNLLGEDCNQDKESLKIFIRQCIISNHECKYFDVVYNAFKSGIKYSQITGYEPRQFDLPMSWLNCFGDIMNKTKLIILAIYYAYDFDIVIYSDNDLQEISRKTDIPIPLLGEVKEYFMNREQESIIWN